MSQAGDVSQQAARGVSVGFHLPAPSLRTAISTYYVLRIAGDAPAEDMMHPEWPNMRLLLSGDWSMTFEGGRTVADTGPSAYVSGTLARSAKVRCGPGVMVGVGLLPAGWARLTTQPAAAYVDDMRPCSDVVGARAGELMDRLAPLSRDAEYCAALDAWFGEVMALDAPVDALLVEAHRALLDPQTATVAQWAKRIGRSTRQLERMSMDYFGMSPKRLLRRQRFLRTFATIRDQPMGAWGRLLDERYADQPQFIREFRHFIGMSPSAYFARPWPFMIAAGNARKALLGAPLQGLHKLDEPEVLG